MKNEMEIIFDAQACNEGFARVAVAAFVAHINPTLEELDDVKTAVSEAVTNAIIHGYEVEQGTTVQGTMAQGTMEQGTTVQGTMEQGAMHQKEISNKVTVKCMLEERCLHIEVSDEGRGIPDIKKAMEPLFTTGADRGRSGMGFSFMEAFMDRLQVFSTPGVGTKVCMDKIFAEEAAEENEE